MLHRALFGSLERFIGILIEHFAGKLPAWLAPTQIVVLTISEAFNDQAEQLSQSLQKLGLRSAVDTSNEKIGYKIRQHTLKRVPFMAVVGAKEAETGQINLRLLDGSNVNHNTLDSAAAYLLQACCPPDQKN